MFNNLPTGVFSGVTNGNSAIWNLGPSLQTTENTKFVYIIYELPCMTPVCTEPKTMYRVQYIHCIILYQQLM